MVTGIMVSMPALRSHCLLARWMLVWFALFLLVAVAAPLFRPQGVTLACTGAGVLKLVLPSDDATGNWTPGHTLDCPLCLTASAPPSAPAALVPPLPDLAYALVAVPVVHIAARLRSPAQARAPPAQA